VKKRVKEEKELEYLRTEGNFNYHVVIKLEKFPGFSNSLISIFAYTSRKHKTLTNMKISWFLINKNGIERPLK